MQASITIFSLVCAFKLEASGLDLASFAGIPTSVLRPLGRAADSAITLPLPIVDRAVSIGRSTLQSDKDSSESKSPASYYDQDEPVQSKTTEAPGSSPFDQDIISTDPKDIRYLLYSKKLGLEDPELLEFGNLTSIKNSQYDPKKPTKILLHGFTMSHTSCFPVNLIKAYFTKNPDDFNILVVDWNKLAMPRIRYIGPLWYPAIAQSTIMAGENLGDFIIWLYKESLIVPNKIHIIGFSLGAHMAGKVGLVVKEKLERKIARITGLDPAGVMFYTGALARRLTPTDAKYVDVYHTDSMLLGMWIPSGQVDFFVNGGGGLQPGCFALEPTVNIATAFMRGALLGTCSHYASAKLFAESILAGPEDVGNIFTVCPCVSEDAFKIGNCGCDKVVTFGEYSPPGTAGLLFIQYTKSLYEVCFGQPEA